MSRIVVQHAIAEHYKSRSISDRNCVPKEVIRERSLIRPRVGSDDCFQFLADVSVQFTT